MRAVVFLRAINTTGRRVKMDVLRRSLDTAGYVRVQSFLASGNLIIDSDGPILASTIEDAIRSEIGFSSTAFVRTDQELLDVVENVPTESDAGMFEIAFLDHSPSAASTRALLQAATGPDRLTVTESEIYWWRPLPLVPPYPKESTVRRLLDMESTRRTLRTVQGIVSTFIEQK
jgi:uncharacterized protein (DUF1697 family)